VSLPLEVVDMALAPAERGRVPVIDNESAKVLASDLVVRIRKLTEGDRLFNHRHLGSLLYSWDRWGKGEPQVWAEGVASAPSGLAHLIRTFRSYAPPGLGKFVDLESAKDRAKLWLADPSIDLEDKASFQALLAPVIIDRLRQLAGASEADMPSERPPESRGGDEDP
jgi:hypothetical protein